MKKAGGHEIFIEEQRVPYVHHNDQWVGYDNAESLREKVRYVKRNNFGGVMVWALPLDDFTGTHCGQGNFPLMHAIVDECQHSTGILHTQAPAQTTLYPPSTTTPPFGQTTSPRPPLVHGDLLDCSQHKDGFYPSARSCSEYFICLAGTTHTVECAPGLVFSAISTFCDWPYNYECPSSSSSTAAAATTTASSQSATVQTTTPVSHEELTYLTTRSSTAPTHHVTETSNTTATPLSTTSTSASTTSTTLLSSAAVQTTDYQTETPAPYNGLDHCGRIVCYTTNWSQYRPGSGKFFPDNIDPSLCTHIIYAFAKIQGNHLAAYEWNDDDTDWSVGLFTRLNNLKQRYPHVKTLLAVGGWNMGSDDFTRIVQSPSNRRDFITHSTTFLRNRNFDGLDMDWEYPANRGSPPEDREHFTAFMRELRQEYENEAQRTGKPRLLLTAAVAAGKSTIDTAYDIPAISQDLDFINLMSYDLHGSWETATGHNSPLYARSDEIGDDRTLNLDFAAQYWVQNGAPKEKLNIGMGLYGRSFTLASSSSYRVGAAALRGGIAGTYTRESGFLSYYEVCDMKRSGGQELLIQEQRVPYVHHNDQWVGFDNAESLREKVRYVKHNNFGGVMVWALPLDDFTGTHCGQGNFPLMHAITAECQHSTGILHTQAPAQTTLHPPSTTTLPSGQTTSAPRPPLVHGDLLDCSQHKDGFYPSARSCSEYFICLAGTAYTVECAPGLVFNAISTFCDWPYNYECPSSSSTTTTTAQSPTQTMPSTPTTPLPTTTLLPMTTQLPTTTVTMTIATTTTPMPTTTVPTTVYRTETPSPYQGLDLTTFCDGLSDGVHADPTDPYHFIQCSNGNTYHMRCAPGSIFTETSRTCERDLGHTTHPMTMTTEQMTVTQSQNPDLDLVLYCIKRTDGVHPDPSDCTHFIECSNGYGYRIPCAPGAVFNEDISTCDNPYNVPTCHGSHRVHIDQSAVKETTASPDLDTYCHGKMDGVHPDPTDCTHFIECSNGNGYRLPCAPGSVFNVDISSCDNPHHVPSCHSSQTVNGV